MNVKHVRTTLRNHSTHAWARRGAPLVAMTALFAVISATPMLAQGSTAPTCVGIHEPGASYPLIPDAAFADVTGEAGITLFLEPGRALVELDGCVYELDRALIVDPAGLDLVTLLVELPADLEDGRVFVTQDGRWVDTIEASSFSYVLEPGHELGFEVASPGQPLPTVPIVIAPPPKPSQPKSS